MSWEHDDEQCPLAAVDRRLEDVHRFWHQAEKAYFDPDGFRVAIQAAIQTARTVTLVLQKNKHIVPDFENWYAPWQAKLGASALMKWMLEARNRIEKQGDLDANSLVSAEIVASHLDKGPRLQVPAKLFDAPLALVKSIPHDAYGAHVMKDGVLRIRRRWIENTLPEMELLDAVATAYGQLSEVVHAAHRQLGLGAPVTTNVTTGQEYPEGDRAGRMPCMIGHEDLRTLDVWLATGEPIEFEKIPHKVDLSKGPELEKRYGVAPSDIYAESGKAEDHARSLFATARKMFTKDGHHITLAFLLREGTPVMLTQLNPEEHGHKYMMMRNLAHEAQRTGADAVVLISESWQAPADPAKPYMRAADSPLRREYLTATLVSKAGESLQISAEILRANNSAMLGETSESAGGAQYAFAPFYQVWGRPIPADWPAVGHTSDSVEKS